MTPQAPERITHPADLLDYVRDGGRVIWLARSLAAAHDRLRQFLDAGTAADGGSAWWSNGRLRYYRPGAPGEIRFHTVHSPEMLRGQTAHLVVCEGAADLGPGRAEQLRINLKALRSTGTEVRAPAPEHR